MKATKKNLKKAFTLVELVVVIAVIAILAAVLIPTFSSVIKNANNSVDQQLVVQLNLISSTHHPLGNGNDEFEFADNIRKMLDDEGVNKDSLLTKNKDVIIVYNTQTKQFERLKLDGKGGWVAFAESPITYVPYYPEEIFENFIIVSTEGNNLAEAIYALHNLPSGATNDYVQKAFNKIPDDLKGKVKAALENAIIIDEGGNAVAIDFSGEPTVTTNFSGKTKVIFSESVKDVDFGEVELPEKIIIPNNVTSVKATNGDLSDIYFAGNTAAVQGDHKTCTIAQARGLVEIEDPSGGDIEQPPEHKHDIAYEKVDEYQHRVYCTKCDYEETETHDFGSDDRHDCVCGELLCFEQDVELNTNLFTATQTGDANGKYYSEGTMTISGVEFAWKGLGHGVASGDSYKWTQWRTNTGTGTSTIWNTQAFAGNIANISFVWYNGSSSPKANPTNGHLKIELANDIEFANAETKYVVLTTGTVDFTVDGDYTFVRISHNNQNAVYLANIVISYAAGTHVWEKTKTEEANCAHGNITINTCIRCGATDTIDDGNKTNNHVFGADTNYVAGSKVHSTECSVCENYIEHDTEFAANGESGHTMSCTQGCAWTSSEAHSDKNGECPKCHYGFTYTVTLNKVGEGNGNSANIDKETGSYGDTVKLTVVVAEGYIATVDINGNVTTYNEGTNTITETINSNLTITVTFSEKPQGGTAIFNYSEIYSNITGSSSTPVTDNTIDDITITFDKGGNSNAPAYFANGTAVRAYAKNTITITSSQYNITQITITYGTGGDSLSITANVGNWSSPNWTGNAKSVVFTIGGSSGNRRIAKIEVTYGAGGGGATDPVDPNPGEGGGDQTDTKSVTFDLASLYSSVSSSQSVDGKSHVSDGITITFAKSSGSNAPMYYNNGTAVRLYVSNTLTVTSSGKNIIKIEFTISADNKGFSVNAGSYSNKTWTGNAASVVFTGINGQNHLQKIIVTYGT